MKTKRFTVLAVILALSALLCACAPAASPAMQVLAMNEELPGLLQSGDFFSDPSIAVIPPAVAEAVLPPIIEVAPSQPSAPVTPSASAPAPQSGITLEQAKALVFQHLGITEADISYPNYEREGSKYELDFHVGNVEYDVDVDAATGKILKLEKEIDEVPVIPSNPTQPTVPDTPPVTAPAPQSGITLEQAKALVFQHLGITEADISYPSYEREGSKYELDFHVGNVEYDVDVDAATGKILKLEKEIDEVPVIPSNPTQPTVPDTPPVTAPAPQSGITLEQAKALVFQHLGITESQTHDREYELDDGKFELSFSVGRMEYEVEVSAATGKILSIEKEIDD